MSTTWLYSDPHFGHNGVCRFMRSDGVTKLRPWDNTEEMDEELIKRFNNKVRPNDKCYFLGDVAINRRALPTLGRLKGDKVLIKGNHDIFRLEEYMPYFRDFRAYHVLSGMILSHIPVHESNLHRFNVNVHGHLHANRVMKPRGVDVKNGEVLYGNEIDPRYICVCVEQTDFAPISLEDVKKLVIEQGASLTSKHGNGPSM